MVCAKLHRYLPCLPPALEFRQSLGGERKINEYCQSLAEEGGKRMAEILGTSVMDTNPPDALNRTAMVRIHPLCFAFCASTHARDTQQVNVELPLSPSIKPSANILRLLQHKLFVERKNYGAPYFHNGKWWARMCAQVYNEVRIHECRLHRIGCCADGMLGWVS